VKDDLESKIQRTSGVLYGDALYGMGVNHRRPDVAMPQQFLNPPDVIVALQQVAGKTVPKSMGHCPFDYSCLGDRLFDSLLHMGFVQMIATIFSCVAIKGQLFGRGKPLPNKLSAAFLYFCSRAFTRNTPAYPRFKSF